jgi:hypothetical protein
LTSAPTALSALCAYGIALPGSRGWRRIGCLTNKSRERVSCGNHQGQSQHRRHFSFPVEHFVSPLRHHHATPRPGVASTLCGFQRGDRADGDLFPSRKDIALTCEAASVGDPASRLGLQWLSRPCLALEHRRFGNSSTSIQLFHSSRNKRSSLTILLATEISPFDVFRTFAR